ncbi:hypothetical protein [Rubrimonas cliftonensis]|uniref:Uncharacterized protein n=1 Tax=Rubrimonas cliftonensis TaxID=89524 RepID=A0A1H4CGF8_9RHOB|nr:hypothetical protein [Rubrimonas cliftonensis]SEA59448.1 hypothetical protein SAMN05444370_10763 [Rubrimonas cliftonensis]
MAVRWLELAARAGGLSTAAIAARVALMGGAGLAATAGLALLGVALFIEIETVHGAQTARLTLGLGLLGAALGLAGAARFLRRRRRRDMTQAQARLRAEMDVAQAKALRGASLAGPVFAFAAAFLAARR